MSLTKLFNFKYLLQNIKKSKMAITLFFIIVPIFTSLMLISIDENVFEYAELGLINIIAMYVIPFVLSVSLFGYVFKKNSVDFMGSMPISRKCIFITNTIGGIVIIFLLQLVTLLLTLLIGTCINGSVFAGMAFDIFIYQTIAYIFVFIISNLAMSVSGNMLTQIVVTLLIAFLIPFLIFFVCIYNNPTYMISNNYGNIVLGFDRIINYTAPSLIFSGTYDFNVISIIKMIILSIVYFMLGLILFDKRKMEIAGESFENKTIHLIVKSLTLAPFVALLYTVIDGRDTEIIPIIIAIIAVYFFIYDLITGKKIKFRDNILFLVVAVLIWYGVHSVSIEVNESIDKDIDISSIKSMTIGKYNDFKYEITDKELISDILKYSTDRYRGLYDNMIYMSNVTVTNYIGKKYSGYLYTDASKVDEIIKKIYPNMQFLSNAKLKQEYFNISNEEEKVLFEKLENALNNISITDLEKLRNDSMDTFSIYEYKNHDIIRHNYPIEMNEDIFKLFIKLYNNYAYQYLEETGNNITWFEVRDYSGKVAPNLYCGNWNSEANGKLYDFILKYHDDEIENYKTGIFINSNDFKFYTDKVDEFIEEVYNYMDKYDYSEKYIDDTVYIQSTDVMPLEDIVIDEEYSR